MDAHQGKQGADVMIFFFGLPDELQAIDTGLLGIFATGLCGCNFALHMLPNGRLPMSGLESSPADIQID